MKIQIETKKRLIRLALSFMLMGAVFYNEHRLRRLHNPYENSSEEERAHFKHVMIPLPPGTSFKISQGAFGKSSHHDPGHEYTWDFDVPYGTPVLSIEDGTVLGTAVYPGKGGCDSKYTNTANLIHIENMDGTVAQYVHVEPKVSQGDVVKRGQVIAVTSETGFICTPQLDFGVYEDRNHIFGTGHPQTIPLTFAGLPEGGMAYEGTRGVVPQP